ncbi:helix-turn-helix domain-containing protein [Pedobacter chinensis]|uniref:Helix-turn-helix domain-containing protein n=1 Tax=Pedobacter chinensis TaxID=2282421 RepID=A0A369PNG2_9SPHI|nr:helix-turn-helix domain-containing protein [Pedobacter chinensis]RDC54133.1 helix-turn-helix domain-containing protein [Pedobacter chinensis]
MKKIDTLIKILYNIYLLLKNHQDYWSLSHVPFPDDEQMTRQEVKDYLKISESTYKRKVKDGTLKPIKMPGGDRFYKRELLAAFQESYRKGRL